MVGKTLMIFKSTKEQFLYSANKLTEYSVWKKPQEKLLGRGDVIQGCEITSALLFSGTAE